MKDDERMTSLRGTETIDKASGAIRRRGMLDSMMAQAVLTAAYAEHFGYENIILGARDLVRVAEILQKAEAVDEPPEVLSILGMSFEELRDTAANPTAEIGLDPYYPGSDTDLMSAYINVLRTTIRSVEIAFCEAPDTKVNREIQRVLNRASTAAYILMLECRSARA